MITQQDVILQLGHYLEVQKNSDIFSGSVLLAKDGQPIFEFTTGFANKERNILNTIETKFNLGSANKMFTAIGIAQLVEKKLLSFEDNIGKYLSDYPNDAVKVQVTIHHLLTHTGGLGSFIDVRYREKLLAARTRLNTIQSVVDLFKDMPLEYPVGEYHYSSNGYELLGLIIETITKQSYYDYVRENIFSIATMPNTDSYVIDPEKLRDDIAIGYTNRDPRTDRMIEGEKFDNLGLNLLKGTAGGGGYSTCHDLLHFANAFLGNELLTPELTQLLITPKITEGSKGNQTKYYGYGFQIFDIGGVKRIGHPGRFAGVNARFDMYPDLGYTFIVLANYDPPAAFNVAEKVTELLIN